MSAAFVDSSVVVSLNFTEAASVTMQRRLSRFDHLYASNLLEAELRSACHREGKAVVESYLDEFEWVEPSRPLRSEIERVLNAGYVRGADCWHLASALYLEPDASRLVFLTLGARQRAVAKALGFSI